MTEEAEFSRAITAHGLDSVLAITVSPRSSRNRLERRADGTLLLRIAAPPVDGAANIAVLKFLAGVLAIPRSRLSIASGETSRRKRILIEGVPPEELAIRLGGALLPGNTPILKP